MAHGPSCMAHLLRTVGTAANTNWFKAGKSRAEGRSALSSLVVAGVGQAPPVKSPSIFIISTYTGPEVKI